MAPSLKAIMSSVMGARAATPAIPARSELFEATDPAKDGPDCLHDCDSCSIRYPRGFQINERDALYGRVSGWSTHVLVGTGKTDWVRDVADEKGSVMEAISKAKPPSNGRLMLSASNMPTPHNTHDYSEPATVLLLPAFVLVENVRPADASALVAGLVSESPTTSSPLLPALPALPPPPASGRAPDAPGLMVTRACPHQAVILMCSQRTRDARCGQSAPLLRRELERHLRPLGLYRDLDDERPGGVGIYFISHTGGHKYAANVMVYRRPNAFGQDDAGGQDGAFGPGSADVGDVGAAQCIWLARVKPQDCENLVRFTVLKGKVVKPESQLRGGFDRAKGLTSW